MGELVSNYETQIAILRAEVTQLVEKEKEIEKAKDEYSKSLEEKISN
jgi:hypothetical protein